MQDPGGRLHEHQHVRRVYRVRADRGAAAGEPDVPVAVRLLGGYVLLHLGARHRRHPGARLLARVAQGLLVRPPLGAIRGTETRADIGLTHVLDRS